MKEDLISRLYWVDVRDDVRRVNKAFFDIIEQISPDRSLPIYKLRYRYGEKIVDRGTFQFPSNSIRHVSVFSKQELEDFNYCAIPLHLY